MPPLLMKASFYKEDETTLKTGKEEMDAKSEQEECNMTFCKELRVCNDEKKQPDDDMQKACALTIKDHCGHLMKTRVEDKHDFETKVRDKPIELLKRVKEYMCVPTQSKCECDGLHKTINVSQ